MLTKYCAHPGCYRIVPAGQRYCAVHASDGERKDGPFRGTKRWESASYNGLYRTARWRRMRREFLAGNPRCAMCGGAAKVVDHIIPHRGDEALFWDEGNWQPLCMSCHSAKTLRENGYFKKNSGAGVDR